MARGGNQKTARSTAEPTNSEAEERRRLSKLAFSNNLLSEAPAKASSLALNPSKTVIKHHGRDILRKSNRKNRFMFSFPGLLAPVSGGKIGELKDLGSKNPIMYLDFPQMFDTLENQHVFAPFAFDTFGGLAPDDVRLLNRVQKVVNSNSSSPKGRMKLFGTIVYPKNRYLTLQFSKGGKNVMCEDYFDNMIVFSDAWWIGNKEENPEEIQLSFPENMNTVNAHGQQIENDFQGGAGSTSERVQKVNQSRVTEVKHHSPIHELETESDSEGDPKELIQTPTPATATRHSTRTSGKSYKFAESSSADDAFDLDDNIESSDDEDKEIGAGSISKDATEIEVTKVSEKVSEINKSATKSKDGSHNNQNTLVQATISTLFKKKEEKMAINTTSHPSSSKVSRKRLQEPPLEDKVDQSKVKVPRKRGKAVKEGKPAAAAKSTPRKKKPKVSDDEIEEISDDSSQDSSDEDWDA